MTFDKWADRTFGSDFKEDETLTYFRMSAAWDAGREEQKAAIVSKLLDLGALGDGDYLEAIRAL